MENINTVQTINGNNPEAVVQIKGMKKFFGKKKVLTNITMDLFKGENLVVLGKSGQGKSVNIKCIVAFL